MRRGTDRTVAWSFSKRRRHVVTCGDLDAAFSPKIDTELGVANDDCVVSIASKTGSRAPGELVMTCSTSEVAVCCSSDCLSSFSNRAFSMAMTAWAAKFCDQLDLFVGERADFLAVNDQGTDQGIFLQHRDGQTRPHAAKFNRFDDCGSRSM